MDDTRRNPVTLAGIFLAVAGPLLWACLVLFHPMPGEGSPYEGISDVVDRWLVVHVGQLLLTPLLVLAVWRLLSGLTSPAATVSRCALVVWAVFFSAYDSIQGIATGFSSATQAASTATAGNPSTAPSTIWSATASWRAISRFSGSWPAAPGSPRRSRRPWRFTRPARGRP